MKTTNRFALLAAFAAGLFSSFAAAQSSYQMDRDAVSFGARNFDQADDRTHWSAASAGCVIPTGASAGRFAVIATNGELFSAISGAPTPPSNGYSAVAVGSDHIVALVRGTGAVQSWGSNTSGQTSVPATLSTASHVAAGALHSVALQTNGVVVCWGSNADTQCSTPSGLLATQIAAGASHTLAVNTVGTIVGWGSNSDGQVDPQPSITSPTQIAAGAYFSAALLSDGTVTTWGDFTPNGVFPTDVARIACGFSHIVGLKTDGTVVAWGGTPGAAEISVPSGLQNAEAVAAGSGQSLAVLKDGSVRAWGNVPAAFDEIGGDVGSAIVMAAFGTYDNAGTTQDRFVMLRNNGDTAITDSDPGYAYSPVEVGGDGSKPNALFSGSFNELAMFAGSQATSGGVGIDASSALLVAKNWDISVPAGLSAQTFSDVALGAEHGVALRTTGAVRCFPENATGQPETFPPAGTYLTVGAGWYHSLAVKSDGTVKCWGPNGFGETTSPSGSTYTHVAGGGSHSMALKADGSVVCWGRNDFGQTNVPLTLESCSGIAAGKNHSVALQSDGLVVAWGDNSSGQCTVPTDLLPARSIAAGANSTFVVRGLRSPQNVAATDGNAAIGGVRVTWNAVVGATSYSVYRTDGVNPLEYLGDAAGSPFVDANAEPLKAYAYFVDSTTADGTSALSRSDTGYKFLPGPASITASDGTSTSSVSLSWPAVIGAGQYEVFRGVGAATDSLGTSAVTTFTDTTASAGVVYTYAVVSMSMDGSNVSDPSPSNTGYRALSAPTSLTATNRTSSAGVDLTWVGVSGAAGYGIYRGVASPNVLIASVATSPTSYTDATAVAGTTYLYAVKATGAPGVAASASSASATGVRGAVPGTAVTASNGTSTAHVQLTWAAAAGATQYQVWRSIGSAAPALVTTVSAPTLTYNDTSAAPGTLYGYRLRVVTAAGTSAYTATDNGWRALITPSGVVATNGTSTSSVGISWTAVTGAVSYTVFRGAESLGTTNTTAFTDLTATPGTKYNYGVTAIGAPGTTATVLSATDEGWRGLSAPTNLASGDGNSTAQVTLSWTQSTGAASYKVYRAPADGSSAAAFIGASVTTQFVDAAPASSSPAAPGVLYNYAVSAVGGAGIAESAKSVQDPGYRRVAAPTNLLASDGTSKVQVQLTWNTVSGATRYRLFRALAPTVPTATASFEITPSTPSITTGAFNDVTATPGQVYNYIATAVGGSGTSDSAISNSNSGYISLNIPIGLAATDGTSTASVSLKWGGVAGASIYKVFRGGTLIQSIPAPVNTDAATYADTSAVAGTLYTYTVKAVVGGVDSEPSAAETGWRKLLAPTAVSASDGTSTSGVTVSWTASTGSVSAYTVYRGTSAASLASIGTASGADTSYVDNSAALVAGTTYFYAVEAVGLAGTGSSDQSAVDTGSKASTTTPTGLVATDGTSPANVGLTWSAVTGATNYKVFRGVGAASTLVTTVGAVTTYTDTSADPGVVYTYAIKAVKGGVDSAASAVDTGYRGLGAPTALTATSGTSTAGVTLKWGAVLGATGYKVLRDGVDITPAGGITAATYADTSAVAGTLHSYAVKAVKTGVQDSAASTSASGWRKLLAPTAVSASDGTSTSGVTVSWTASTGSVSAYKVYRGASAASLVPIGTASGADTSYVDTSAVAGTTYFYAVEAVGLADTGSSDRSAVDSGYRASTTTPTGLVATDGTSTANVGLTWSAVTGATNYKVFRGVGAASTLVTTVGAVTTYTDTSADPGVVYTYAIKAVKDDVDSAASAVDTGYRGLGAPTALTATSGTSTAGVTLQWSAPGGATSYKVFRDGAQIATPSSTSYVDSTVLAGALSSYVVKASGVNILDSVASAPATGWRRLSPPTTVTAIGAAASITVSWNAADGNVNQYLVYRGTGTTKPVAPLVTLPPTTLSYADLTPVSGQNYNYYVVARGPTGTGDSEYSAAAQASKSPAAPTAVAASDGTSGSSVTVTWSASAGATGYKVFRGVGSASTQLSGVIVGTSFTDTTPEPGVIYTYAVKATVGGANGDSGISASDTGYVRLAAPSALAASDGTRLDAVFLTWNTVPGATSYTILRGTGATAPVGIAASNVANYLDSSATPGVLYSYTVQASVSGMIDSLPSAANAGCRRLSPPTGVTATQGTNPTFVTVSWTAPASGTVLRYEIYRANDSVPVALAGTVQAPVASFNDGGGVTGTVYRYTVKAVGQSDLYTPSDASLSATGWRAPTGVPAGLTASDGSSSDGVSLTWNAVAGATSYKIYRGVAATPSTFLGSSTTPAFNDASAVPGTLYTYGVRSVLVPSGESALSSTDTGYRKLATPAAPVATAGTSTSNITVTWNAVSGAATYLITRSGGGSETVLGPVGGTVYVDTATTPGASYAYALRAITGTSFGNSDLSSQGNGWRSLSAPTGVTATQGTSSTGVTITWIAPSGTVMGYQVYRNGAPIDDVLPPGTSGYIDTDVSATPGVKYTYTVTAIGDVGTGPSAASAPVQGWAGLIGAPTNVTATDGISSSAVSVTWAAVAGATSYEIWRGSSTPTTKVGTSTTTSYSDTSAVSGRTYAYAVKAVSVGGVSVLSTADTGFRSFVIPTNVSASDGTSTVNVRVTWTTASGVSAYEVYRGSTLLGTATTGSFTDTTAVQGAPYSYKVRATGAAGTIPSAYSTTDDGWRNFPAPTNAVASTDDPLRIVIEWSTVPSVTKYAIYRGTSVGDMVLLKTPVMGTSYRDTTAVPGLVYVYAVVSQSAAGYSAYSNLAYGLVPSNFVGGDTTAKGSNDDPNSGVGSHGGEEASTSIAPMGVQRYLQVIADTPDAQVLCSVQGASSTDGQVAAGGNASGGDESSASGESEAGDASSGGSFIDLDEDGRPDLCQLLDGDLNLDGVLDQGDLAELLLLIGEPPASGIGDFNHDGSIDIGDVQMLNQRIAALPNGI